MVRRRSVIVSRPVLGSATTLAVLAAVVIVASVSLDEVMAGWRRDAWTEGAVIGAAGSLLLILLGCGLEAHRRRIADLLVTLQEADQRSRILADHTSDMVSLMALDGTRLYVSPASRELLGYAPEELVGTNPKTMVHRDDAAQLRAVFDDLVAGVNDRAVNINRLQHRDGRWVWVEASLRLLRDQAGQPSKIVASVRDVTDRQQAVEALRESEARYRVLAETTRVVITQLDAAMRLTYVSPVYRDLLGYAPEEMLGRDPSAHIHPDDAAEARALVERLMAGDIAGNRTVTTYRTRHERGHWVLLEAAISRVHHGGTGTPPSLICSLRDITKRQRVTPLLDHAKVAGRSMDAVEAAGTVAAPALSGAGGGTLLLAEDNATNAEIIAAMLSNRGYAVSVVENGAAAVEATAREPAPDLVLMDLQMPVMDGLTATAAIRAREAEQGRRRLPIVALTANARAEDAARCRAGGMDAHVAKPVVWPELFATIDKLLDEGRPPRAA